MSPDQVPMTEDLLRLPNRAKVAFAARCARRVQPLYQGHKDHKAAIERAISWAENFAQSRSQQLEKTLDDAIADDDHARVAADDAADDAADAAAAVFAAHAAYAAYAAAAYANVAADASAAADAAGHAENAAGHAAYAAAFAATTSGQDALLRAIASDFLLLLKAVKEGSLKADTLIPPSFFGPLWLDGVPPWSKEGLLADRRQGDDLQDDEIVLEIDIPDDATEEEVLEGVRDLVDAADRLHRASGGRGLKVKVIQQINEAGVPAEVLP
jgi:hypothetical protein